MVFSPAQKTKTVEGDLNVVSIDFTQDQSNNAALPIPTNLLGDVEELIAEEGQVISYSDLSYCFTTHIQESFEERQKLDGIPARVCDKILEVVNRNVLFREAEIQEILLKLASRHLQGLHLVVSSQPGEGKTKVLESISRALQTYLTQSSRYHVIHQVAMKNVYNVVYEYLGQILSPDYLLDKEQDDYEMERLRRIKDNQRAFEEFMSGNQTEEHKLKKIFNLATNNETRLNIFYFLDANCSNTAKEISVLQEMLLECNIDLRIVQTQPMKTTYFEAVACNSFFKLCLKKYELNQMTEIIRNILLTKKKITIDRHLLKETIGELQLYTTNLHVLINFFTIFGNKLSNHKESLVDLFETLNSRQEDNLLRQLTRKELLLVCAGYLCTVNIRKENTLGDPKSADLLQKMQAVKLFSYHELDFQFKELVEHLDVTVDTLGISKFEINKLIDQGLIAISGGKYHTLVDKNVVNKLLKKMNFPVRLEDLVRN